MVVDIFSSNLLRQMFGTTHDNRIVIYKKYQPTIRDTVLLVTRFRFSREQQIF